MSAEMSPLGRYRSTFWGRRHPCHVWLKQIAEGFVEGVISDDAILVNPASATRWARRKVFGEWATDFVSKSKNLAKRKGMEHDITVEFLMEKLEKQRYKCALSGVALSLDNERANGQRVRCRAPSVDRIDSSQGYTQSNCRIVSTLFNLALNEFTDEQFTAAVMQFLKRRGYVITRRSQKKSEKKTRVLSKIPRSWLLSAENVK